MTDESELSTVGAARPAERRLRRTLRPGQLRLRTLILIRWIAAGGQTTTVLTVHFGLGFVLPLDLCLAVIATTVVSNLVLMRRRARRARLDDREAAALLGFDLLQLGVLLFLTGGLLNPFAILIIAPVMVSATILSRGATIALTCLALACITLLALYHEPLPWEIGIFELPPDYVLAIWTALAVALVFLSTYVWSVADEARRMSDALAETQASLARAQRLSALGGLAAAAAHELGSPLATIAVVAKELSSEVPPDSPIAEDVALLLSQSARCREILALLAERPETSGGEPYERLPLSVLVESAAANYRSEDIEIEVVRDPLASGAEPIVSRSPEILHGLGNLIQNAAQFAQTYVEIRLAWDDGRVRVVVHDDGPGFPPALFAAIGEPYISTRAARGEHMGLGIFIAQVLLERAGAELSFRNREGAEVAIVWPRSILEGLRP